ncbi:hypothetical protein GRI97_09020 [Altererythrobacter xixiisoli]|uniref:Polysaccharide biosynthesis protein n=1 Tax=Croceibacterium xixiisoli TaxID=1476466 RepID=A0A6I4TV81_9SPHN|nr:hypothetical protein [Croceibacterium xixiisoli]MXO99129.1 hypothetical protein [Croceibacterium xixiisoli]
MLYRLAPADFGRFTFLLIAAQFSWAIGSSLFSAPLARLEHDVAHPEGRRARASLDSANFLFSLLIGALALFGAWRFNISPGASAVFACMVIANNMRLFGRAAAYAEGQPSSVVRSDVIYTAVALIGLPVLFFNPAVGMEAVFILLAVGSLVAISALLPFLRIRLGDIGAILHYTAVWRRFSSWSLIGVVATEATANAHSYIVAFSLGAEAFVPIAVSSVLIRPATVALQALSEFERARMARLIARGEEAELRHNVLLFRSVLAAGLLATIAGILLLFGFAPELLTGGAHDERALHIGAALWTLVLLIRCAYMPEAVVLQACGAFDALAYPKLWSAPVSVVAAMGLIMVAQPVWSLAAIAAGELVAAFLIFLAARATLAATLSASPGNGNSLEGAA